MTNPLGQETHYPQQYNPELLFAVPRDECRSQLGLQAQALPFDGEDIWTAYELSWLDLQGKPQVRIGELRVAADSVNLVESKSLKLYLNSLNQQCFASDAEVLEVIQNDIERCVQGRVTLDIWKLDQAPSRQAALPGTCIDELAVSCEEAAPDAAILQTGKEQVSEALYSHLLKSNCPVTGQPDWATLWIRYTGKQIEQASLLRYLVSYRQHQDYHENCVERIYSDIMQQCQPEELEVYARYTRRGGLDINPYRSSVAGSVVPLVRLSRQ